MQNLFLALLTAVLLLTACNTQPSNTYKPAPAIGTTEQAEGESEMIMPDPQNTAVPASPSSNTALNPEHGQPGHRCDIAVGAPLNGSPAPSQEISSQLNTGQPQAPASVLPQPAAGVPAPAEKANTGNKKLNPEHGQPGHDCAVPVGSPLP